MNCDRHTLVAWGRLLRVPNLFTVPGDPVAGFLLASGGVLGWGVAGGIATSLCLYAAGLLLNDYFDREVDARERPERPIPSGAVRPRTVLVAGLVLLAAGIAVALAAGGRVPGLVAAMVAVAVVAYDAALKNVKGVGQIVMGSCRAGSVLVGAAFAGAWGDPSALVAAAIAWSYTTAVTVLAAGEASGAPLGRRAFIPCLVLLLGGCAMAPFFGCAGGVRFFGIAVLGIAILDCCAAALDVHRGRLAVPPFIGRLIRTMIATQAAWSVWRVPADAMGAGVAIFAACALLKLGADFSARRFYGS